MTMHIDGNGVAGLLAELAGADMTKVLRTCPSCRTRRPLGEHLAFRSAGLVLRCPGCTEIAVAIGVPRRRSVVEWRGIYEIEES
jgi:hypothetical protein